MQDLYRSLTLAIHSMSSDVLLDSNNPAILKNKVIYS